MTKMQFKTANLQIFARIDKSNIKIKNLTEVIKS